MDVRARSSPDYSVALVILIVHLLLDPDQVLRAPRRLTHTPDADTRRRIGIYFAAILQNRRGWSQVAALLPKNMQIWGKMRIISGDTIRTSITLKKATRSMETYRNNSYIRVHTLSIIFM